MFLHFALRDSQNAMVVYSTGGMMKESQAATVRDIWKLQAGVPVTIKFSPGGNGLDMKAFLDGFDGKWG
ncbi:MAG: hypothetical protein WC865_10775 [Bacteroidales bacterium]